MALRLRRGTDAERLTITPLQGELIYTTDTGKIYIGDGATQGGNLVGPYDLENDASPQLAGNLDLNGNDIVGTGNINITGTVTATGDINLGDADADSITVAGLINSNLRPAVDKTYDLGSASRYWANLYAMGATIEGALSADSLLIGDIYANDSTVIYDSATGSLSVNTVNGNVIGSVFGDDSTPLVDGVSNLVRGNVLNTTTTTQNLTAGPVVIQGTGSGGTLAGIRINTEGSEDDGFDLFTINGANDGVNGQYMAFNRARGTLTSPQPLQDGDVILGQYWLGADSNSTGQFAAGIQVIVDGTPTAGVTPGKMNFAVTSAGGTPTTALALGSDTLVEFVADNTVAANSGSGTADVSGGVATYLKIKVNGTEYAMPLYGIVA
jgi:hypothetical protein